MDKELINYTVNDLIHCVVYALYHLVYLRMDSFRPLAQVDTNHIIQESRLSYVVTDHAGTPRELCSESGEVIWRGRQAIWGEYHHSDFQGLHKQYLEDPANDPVICDLRHQGQIFDRETGLYYNRHRYYDTDIGQYLSSDPIGMAGGLRPQAYVFNPMDWVDPLGLTSFKAAFRQAKRNLNIPKNVNTPKPVRVWDSKYENRTVWAFEGEHKGKFVIMHDEDKFGRGKHLHTATSQEGRVDPTEPGKYNQHPGHIPEDEKGFGDSRKGCPKK